MDCNKDIEFLKRIIISLTKNMLQFIEDNIEDTKIIDSKISLIIKLINLYILLLNTEDRVTNKKTDCNTTSINEIDLKILQEYLDRMQDKKI